MLTLDEFNPYEEMIEQVKVAMNDLYDRHIKGRKYEDLQRGHRLMQFWQIEKPHLPECLFQIISPVQERQLAISMWLDRYEAKTGVTFSKCYLDECWDLATVWDKFNDLHRIVTGLSFNVVAHLDPGTEAFV